jgi:DNA-directed RNA polymerase specialized sigma54-like protein
MQKTIIKIVQELVHAQEEAREATPRPLTLHKTALDTSYLLC